MKVMILVTHLLGTGHLSRALTLGKAFAKSGHSACVVSGGMPAPQLDSDGVDLINLPPLRSDGTDFRRLLGQDGNIANDAYLDARRAMLRDRINAYRPDLLITELFPFGRRSLAAEFETALSTAQALPERPIILASVRDILAPPSKSSKVARAEDLIAAYYDGVLIHSNPDVTPLNVSWPVSARLQTKLYYTGYVTQPPAQPHPQELGRDEILVSAGGGSVGQPIFRAAIEAARKMTNRRWRLLVGGQDAAERIKQLKSQAQDLPITIEPVRPDFRQMLPHATASISMCGYNTALDILQSGTPAVFIPFDDGKEVEQSLRAQSLSGLSGIGLLYSRDMSGDTLTDAVNHVLADPARIVSDQGFDGATRSVEIAERLVEART